MRAIRGFGRFWWDFVVGDDWRVALGVAAAIGVAAALATTVDAWWVLPVAVPTLLWLSVRREAKRARASR
jgi:hypothetical protein